MVGRQESTSHSCSTGTKDGSRHFIFKYETTRHQGRLMDTNWLKPIAALLLAGLAITASAEDGVTDSTILIGQTVGLTGIVAGPIKELNEGAAAYLAGINKKGGVHGRKIQI